MEPCLVLSGGPFDGGIARIGDLTPQYLFDANALPGLGCTSLSAAVASLDTGKQVQMHYSGPTWI